MPITVVFDPPLPGDSREIFNTKAFDTVAKFNPWSSQANDLASGANADALAATAAAEIANSVAHFRGPWSSLSGPLDVPASCSHDSGYWLLLESVADVTAHEPGVSAVWALYDSDFARLTGADFAGPVTVPAGASGAQVPQAQETPEIIENVNGRAVMFPSGRMECETQISGLVTTIAASPLGHRTDGASWTFPAVFVSPPVMHVTGAYQSGGNCNGATAQGATTTSGTFVVYGQANTTVVRANLTAVGRWK